MLKKITFYLLCLYPFLAALNVYGQSSNPAPNKEYYTPPEILPKTPQTEGLFKYTPFPVDYASGSVNTTIPLYTVTSGRLTLPISISYNASGIRVQDIASMIGLGWNLNFGYSISVTEEETKPYVYSAKQYKTESAALAATNLNEDWMNEMKRSADGYYNSMKPIYNYRCGQFSGTFLYDDYDRLRKVGNQVNVKIDRMTASNGYLLGFTLTTGDGVKYVFDQRETTKRISQDNPSVNPQTTAFWCSSITDLLTGDNISFTFRSKPSYEEYSNENYHIRYYTSYANGGNDCGYNPFEEIYTMGRYQVNSLQVDKISFNGGYVSFSADDSRLDIDKTKITGLNIYSAVQGNVLKKKINFEQSYFQTNGGLQSIYNYRFRLDAVNIQPVQLQVASTSERYSFEYNTTPLPPYRVVNRLREANCTGVDYWGFYNGNEGGTSLIPTQIKNEALAAYPNAMAQINFTSTDRKANPAYTQAGILTRINYPTKGYATFEYENHSLSNYYLGNSLGGVRIKSVQYFNSQTATNPVIKKTYNYLSAEPLTPADRQLYSYLKTQAMVGKDDIGGAYLCPNPQKVMNVLSSSLHGIGYYKGSPVFYGKVEEIDGTGSSTNGKTVHYTKFQSPPYALSTIKEYDYKKLMPNIQDDALIDSVEIYKSDVTSTSLFTLIAKDKYTYSGASPDSLQNYLGSYRMQVGLAIAKNDNLYLAPYTWDLAGPRADSWYTNEAYYRRIPREAFIYNDLYMYTTYYRLASKQSIQYNHGIATQTTSKYFYDSPNHQQLTRLEMQNSNGETQKTTYKYIQDATDIQDADYLEYPNGAFKALMLANKFDDIIEENVYLDNVLIKRNRAKYQIKYPNAENYVMPFVRSKHSFTYTGTQIGEQKLFMPLYDDHLNLMEQQYESGTPTAYLRNETSTEMMAQVVGSNYIDTYYTSFETGSKGKWSYTGSSQYDSNAKSGGYIFNLSTTEQIRSASTLSSAKTYIVSYWSRNGAYAINGTINVKTGENIKGWRYYQHLVTGQTSITVSGIGDIDELRLYPLGAKMTTYTYDPMVGITSVTSPNNQSSYYEYDAFQRLVNVRDQDGKVIKHYEYHYQNQ